MYQSQAITYEKSAMRIPRHDGLIFNHIQYSHVVCTQHKFFEPWKCKLQMSILRWNNQTLFYKPIPYIYCSYPCQEDLYWLFRKNATLLSRQISSVIDLAQPYPLSTLRKRKVKKAEKLACLRMEFGKQHLKAYWQILNAVLQSRHDTLPVHTLEEMELLM